MTLFPLFLKLEGRRVLVVGGGPVAASKLASLRAAGADVLVVAPEVCASIRETDVQIAQRPFEDADLDTAWLVVAAATPAVNARVARAAEERQIFVNAVDDPANASAYLGGVVRRSGVTLAISTSGEAPALAGLLREGLDRLLPADLDRWGEAARDARRDWKAGQVPMADRRPLLLDALNAIYDRDAALTPAAGRERRSR
ncbi:MAG TPA: bifunctional precorrin-2 dehydrogenase/sirohydrochlorin ferrochelatase [Vicinamibacterales bacterium]|jgi:uroporphyrin-III C-methyltransferase/precorrin-2 dehydrogenase/sirohydrochlorin ferrochelatase